MLFCFAFKIFLFYYYYHYIRRKADEIACATCTKSIETPALVSLDIRITLVSNIPKNHLVYLPGSSRYSIFRVQMQSISMAIADLSNLMRLKWPIKLPNSSSCPFFVD
jgi:hypothetical protein